MKQAISKAIVACGGTVLCGSVACGSSAQPAPPMSYADYVSQAVTGVHDGIATHLDELHAAAVDVQNAAPLPKGRGWDATQDKAAIAAMQAAWQRARTAYEEVEGAVAPIFPDLDRAIDARYDDFLSGLPNTGDADLFDGQGVTGMHAIERILYANDTPQRTVVFEKTLPGYQPQSFPTTEAAAAEMKNKLCAQLITDVETLQREWQPSAIDVGGAFQGLVSLMNEQREKVSKAATGEEESRYSQRTLTDLRANLDGTEVVYDVFRPWILSKSDGTMLDTTIQSGFQALHMAYDADPGDALPAPPAMWSSQAPSAQDLATPFGQLYSAVYDAVDSTRMGSIVDQMNQEALLLGFPEFMQD